jgi:hypothetical protein
LGFRWSVAQHSLWQAGHIVRSNSRLVVDAIRPALRAYDRAPQPGR